MLELLDASLDLRESIVGEKPEGVYQYSKSGSIPLLVHGNLVLTESRVMLEYLAEYFAFTDAYPEDLVLRSRHRRAMAIVDNFFAPLLFGHTNANVDRNHFDDALDIIEEITNEVPRPNILSLHIVPIWLRFQMWHPGHVVTQSIESRDTLCQWLNTAAQIECLKRTLPDTAIIQEDLAKARRLALMPN